MLHSDVDCIGISTSLEPEVQGYGGLESVNVHVAREVDGWQAVSIPRPMLAFE
jgi:hypothetical protein